MNVYLNGGYPADAITAATDVSDDDLDDEAKMEYYMALSKAYESIGDEEKSNYYYYDKYLVVYNKVFDGGGGVD